MKILRVIMTIENTLVVYVPDEELGQAEVTELEYKAYINASNVISKFEEKIDRIYEQYNDYMR